MVCLISQTIFKILPNICFCNSTYMTTHRNDRTFQNNLSRTQCHGHIPVCYSRVMWKSYSVPATTSLWTLAIFGLSIFWSCMKTTTLINTYYIRSSFTSNSSIRCTLKKLPEKMLIELCTYLLQLALRRSHFSPKHKHINQTQIYHSRESLKSHLFTDIEKANPLHPISV